MIGIYKIENKVNGKVYIGRSINIEKRWSQYRNYFKHLRGINQDLIEDIKLYGKNAFTFSIIEECLKEDLDTKEMQYINEAGFKDKTKCYNLHSSLRSIPQIKRVHLKDRNKICKLYIKDNKTISEIANIYELTIEQVENILRFARTKK